MYVLSWIGIAVEYIIYQTYKSGWNTSFMMLPIIFSSLTLTKSVATLDQEIATAVLYNADLE